jgi:hypothetical protein
MFARLHGLASEVCVQLKRQAESGTLDLYVFGELEEEGSSVVVHSPVAAMFRDAMMEVIDLYAETFPHLQYRDKRTGKVLPFVRLPSGLYPHKKDLYKELMDTEKLPERFSLTYFHQLWSSLFPNVCIKAWNPFAKCDVCVKFRSQLLATTDKLRLAQLKAEQLKHRELVKVSRARLKLRENLALDEDCSPHCTFVIFDTMDSNKTKIPRLRSDATNCKAVEASGEPVPFRTTGFLQPHKGLTTFWSLPRFEKGPNGTCTYLLYVLKKVRTIHAMHGGKLTLFSC